MGKPANDFVYYFKRKDETHFEVAKFDNMSGGDQPIDVYNVEWDEARQRGKCDCWAYFRHKTGINDKHIRGVRAWIAGGEKVQEVKLT